MVSYIPTLFLDRHQVWRSHDPTSVQTFDFCEKAVIPPFFISHLFVVRIIFEKMQFLFIHIVFFITLVISPGYCLVYPPRLSAQAIHLGYPQGYPPSQSHLMLPNLTNQVIKLSKCRPLVRMKFGLFFQILFA